VAWPVPLSIETNYEVGQTVELIFESDEDAETFSRLYSEHMGDAAPSPKPAVDAMTTGAVEVKLPQKLTARAEKIVAAYLAECCKPGEIDYDARHEILCDAANLLKDILDMANEAHPASEPKALTLTDEQRDAVSFALSIIGLSGDPRVRNVHKVLRALLADRGS